MEVDCVNWDFLLLLACPLMMLFCMKGMFTGNKDKENKKEVQLPEKEGLQSIQLQMAELLEQNRKLTEEVNALKGSNSSGQKVIQLEKERERVNA